MPTRPYGWKPDRPDHRDHLFARAYRSPIPLPKAVKPLTQSIPAQDQGDLGSCTGHGCGRLWAHRVQQETGKLIMPSRLFIYYNERVIEGTIPEDAGAEVRSGLKVLAKLGAPPEPLWPYLVTKYAKKPPAKAYTAAKKGLALAYASVPVDKAAIESTLAAGNPIVFGFTVFKSFESGAVAKSGNMPMPGKKEKPVGGHCVVADGYDSHGMWCANSWGPDWGKNGWFHMPWANLPNCSDLWVLTDVK